MSRFERLTASLGAAALLAFVACANSGPETNAAPPSDEAEGGALPPPEEAGIPDDASDDAGEIDAGPRECSKEGFCHTAPPPDQTLRGVWSDGGGATWAVSEQGAILRYDGKAWSVHASKLGPLFSIWGSGPTDIWVGGEKSIFHGRGDTSASLTFTAMDTPGPRTPITSIWGTGANDVWATGGVNDFPLLGRVLHYNGAPGKDGADPEWLLEDVSRDAIWLSRVFGSKASGVWVAGIVEERSGWFFNRRTVVLRRPAGEDEFVKVDLPRDPDFPDSSAGDLERLFDASASADGLSVWLLGKTGGSSPAYLRATSSDGGQTFTWGFGKTGSATAPPFNAVGAITANDAYMVGDYGRLWHWNGAKWKQSVITVTKFPVTTPFYALGGQGNDLWFVGEGIAIHRDPSKAQP